MQLPINGHLDPDFWDLLLDLARGAESALAPSDGLSLCFSASGTSGMEAGMANLVEPGDTVLVLHAGFFGARIAEMARRAGPTSSSSPRRSARSCRSSRWPTRSRSIPTRSWSAWSTRRPPPGVRYPVEELGPVIANSGAGDALLLADCVTSLGGEVVAPAAWGIDYAYSCSQKSLGCPPGLSPFSVSPRALERIADRKAPVSFSFDIAALRRYWIERPITYHHTMPILQYYALYEGIRLALEEGLEARWARHEDAGRYFQQQMRDRGYTFLSDPDHQLWELSAIDVPDGVDGKDDPDADPARVRDRGGRRARTDRAADLARWTDGREREPRDCRSGHRRVRHRPATVGHGTQGPASPQ